jgi:CubicO group peptidase (beta-lactamase class C family)
MKKMLLSLYWALVVLGANSQGGTTSTLSRSQQLDTLLTSLHKQQKFYGNVLVAEKGNVIYQRSFGKANEETGADLNNESIFELASVSKQFTAMGIMLLKKQGKLSYDDSLRHFFPELPYSNITVRHLLNHTSGLPDYMNLMIENCNQDKIATNADMIRLLSLHKPAIHFLPGIKWEYSNTGYALLASIIEKASGKSFAEYLEKNIFKPLGMKRTMVFRRRFEKKTLDNYAYGYGYNKLLEKFILPDDDSGVAKMVICLDGIVGDGTVNSTTSDLLKWDRALYTDQLLPKEQLEEAFQKGVLNDGRKTDYGFGWGIYKLTNIGRVVSHTGGWPGYNTLIERHLDSTKLIIILRNHETNANILQKIRNILYGLKEEIKKETPIASDSLNHYTGKYELAPEFILTVFIEEGKLFGQATGQGKVQLIAEKQDIFYVKEVEAKIKFERDEKGIVRSMVLYQNGQEVPGSKIE